MNLLKIIKAEEMQNINNLKYFAINNNLNGDKLWIII